jgi:hypothetical protein
VSTQTASPIGFWVDKEVLYKMPKQVVNTDRIISSVNKLRTVNGNINTAFSTLQIKIKQLNNWKGAAGTAAQTTAHHISQNNEVRSAVIQNYINMLEQQVNLGYIETETVNKKLADNFK